MNFTIRICARQQGAPRRSLDVFEWFAETQTDIRAELLLLLFSYAETVKILSAEHAKVPWRVPAKRMMDCLAWPLSLVQPRCAFQSEELTRFSSCHNIFLYSANMHPVLFQALLFLLPRSLVHHRTNQQMDAMAGFCVTRRNIDEICLFASPRPQFVFIIGTVRLFLSVVESQHDLQCSDWMTETRRRLLLLTKEEVHQYEDDWNLSQNNTFC